MTIRQDVAPQASAEQPLPTRWTEVYETDYCERALQVANMLDAIGLEVDIQYDTRDTEHPVSHVWVREAQTNRAIELLTAYGLTA